MSAIYPHKRRKNHSKKGTKKKGTYLLKVIFILVALPFIWVFYHELFQNPIEEEVGNGRVLVLFYGGEKDNVDAMRNLAFFKDFGLFRSKEVDFRFILAEGSGRLDVPKSISSQVSVEYREENKILDDWLNPNVDPLSYQYYIFIRASVRGPFLPTYGSVSKWPYYITQYLSDSTKMVGIIGSYFELEENDELSNYPEFKDIHKYHHLNGNVLAVDQSFFLHGFHKAGQNIPADVKENSLHLLVSKEIISKGFRIQAIAWAQQAWDFENTANKLLMNHFFESKRSSSACKLKSGYDAHLPHCYFGMNPNPFDFIFIQTKFSSSLDPDTMYYSTGQFSRFLYIDKIQCEAPNWMTLGATCSSRGGWIYRTKTFECFRVEPYLLLIIDTLRDFLSDNSIQHVVDIGGGLGSHCRQLKDIEDLECKVLEPAPLADCMPEGVSQIQGNILDPDFYIEDIFEAAMFINTIDYLADETNSNIFKFLQEHISKYIIIVPPKQKFQGQLARGGWKESYSSREMVIMEKS